MDIRAGKMATRVGNSAPPTNNVLRPLLLSDLLPASETKVIMKLCQTVVDRRGH